jgi:hypothetical protein
MLYIQIIPIHKKNTFCVGGNTMQLVTVSACMRLARHPAMQGLRPLSHSGSSIHKVFNAYQLPCTEYQNTKILHRTLKVFHLNDHFIF